MKKLFSRVLMLALLAALCLALPALAETAQTPVATIDVTDIVTALLGLLASIVTAYLAPRLSLGRRVMKMPYPSRILWSMRRNRSLRGLDAGRKSWTM